MTSSTRAWTTWLDWCTATGHSPEDLTSEAVAVFAGQVPKASVSAVMTAARRQRIVALEKRDPWTLVEGEWSPVPASLTRCPVYGWPAAVAGRRDAWLILLTRVLRLPRSHAATFRAKDVPRLLNRLDQVSLDGICVRCVTHRWLEVVATYSSWSRSAVRSQVWSQDATRNPVVVSAGSAQPCNTSCARIDGIIAALPSYTVLAPAIDRHGWWVDWRPMSPRSVTTVLAARCDRLAPASTEVVESAVAEGTVRSFDDTTFERLDAAIEAADEMNARLEALLRDFDRSV